MFIVNSYLLAVVLCVVTMICWGSWGNTQKLAARSWRYELYYWDYVIGILLLRALGRCKVPPLLVVGGIVFTLSFLLKPLLDDLILLSGTYVAGETLNTFFFSPALVRLRKADERQKSADVTTKQVEAIFEKYWQGRV